MQKYAVYWPEGGAAWLAVYSSLAVQRVYWPENEQAGCTACLLARKCH
jgi:undecaprenyl pyrophosphate synthase